MGNDFEIKTQMIPPFVTILGCYRCFFYKIYTIFFSSKNRAYFIYLLKIQGIYSFSEKNNYLKKPGNDFLINSI